MPPQIIPGTIIIIHIAYETWIKMKMKARRNAGFLMDIEQHKDQEVKVRGESGQKITKKERSKGECGLYNVMAVHGGRERGVG